MITKAFYETTFFIILFLISRPAFACGGCAIASADNFLPPIYGWVGLGLIWFFAVALINSWFLRNRRYIGSLLVVILYFFGQYGWGFYPHFIIFYILACWSTFKVLRSGQHIINAHRLSLKVCVVIAVIGIVWLVAQRQYILTHRTDEQYARQWSNTNPGVRMLLEIERKKAAAKSGIDNSVKK